MSYYRTSDSGGYYRPSFFRGGFRFFPPVIKWLIISNVGIWILVDFFLVRFTISGVWIGKVILDTFALNPIGPNFWPWQIFTYMFLHGGFGHIFFNMFALWMFGMEVEHIWGSRKFLVYYLSCGFGAATANLLVAPLLGQVGPTVGASGGVFGILIAFGMMFPNRPIYLYFLLPIKAKYFIAAYIGLELFYGVTGTADGIAHFAHLGGAAVGFVYMLSNMNMIPAGGFLSRLRFEIKNPFAKDDRFTRRDGSKDQVYDAKFYDIKSRKPVDESREVNQEVIDAILDKISKGGYQSLTQDEKRILDEASRKMH